MIYITHDLCASSVSYLFASWVMWNLPMCGLKVVACWALREIRCKVHVMIRRRMLLLWTWQETMCLMHLKNEWIRFCLLVLHWVINGLKFVFLVIYVHWLLCDYVLNIVSFSMGHWVLESVLKCSKCHSKINIPKWGIL